MIKIIKKILLVFIIVIILMNMVLLIKGYLNPDKEPDILGYKWYVVLSGSMENTININDVVIVKEVVEKDLNVGDIISFNSNNSIVTHRIIEIKNIDGDIYYTTKGDSNNTEDKSDITIADIEGKFVFRIPKLGVILNILQNKITITVVMIILFIVCLI